jgi:hypothetical protein
MPTLNDIPHTFTFYLFPQPDNFALPAWDAGRNYTVVGAPIAANYYRTYNRSNTATGSFSNGTCPSFLAGTGVGGNATGSGFGSVDGSGTPPPSAEFTGLAGRIKSGAGYLLAALGVAVFAMM